MVRAFGVDRTDREPALLMPSRVLSIRRYARGDRRVHRRERSSADPGWGGWRLQMDELRSALNRAKAAGVSAAVVSGAGENSEGMPNLSGGLFLGVIRLMHQLKLL